ncbi:MAG: diphthine--ammonia ligase [Prevotellaceae bacterium]|jgi:uncharacterized protein (TIGR00290 family)|nr:diphthine--ammonia ligase [Prevotellaceae bacterium]
MRKKAVFNWSGGKDSAFALYKTLQSNEYDAVSLLTTVNSKNKRSFMHAIPVALLQEQADSIGIPLYLAEYDPDEKIKDYDNCMLQAVEHFKKQGVNHFIFGDIFLHDVRSYREKQLNPHGIEVVEPLWNKKTIEIMQEFLQSGLKTIVVTTMADLLDERYIGLTVDRSFVENLPDNVDILGENGEYHTFCFDGPIFKYPVKYSLGTSFKTSHTVNMDDGTQQTFNYWYANLNSLNSCSLKSIFFRDKR